jgi:hypothetical protein
MPLAAIGKGRRPAQAAAGAGTALHRRGVRFQFLIGKANGHLPAL